MTKYLTAIAAVLVLSSGAFGISTTWTGATSTDWMDTANWTNGVPESRSYISPPYDDIVFDANSTNTNPMLVSNWPNYARAQTVTFNKPGGYTVNGTSGYASFTIASSVSLLTADCYTVNAGIVPYSGNTITINTVAGSTLVINAQDPFGYGSNPHVIVAGQGRVTMQSGSGVDGLSLTTRDCATVDVQNVFRAGRIYNLTTSALSTVNLVPASYTFMSAGNVGGVTTGQYNMAAPVTVTSIAQPDYGSIITFDYSPGGSTISGLNARFLSTNNGSGDVSGNHCSLVSGNKDLDFTDCRFSGTAPFFVSDTLHVTWEGTWGTGNAKTLKARGTTFAPDVVNANAIMTVYGNLQLFDNKDINNTPCKLVTTILGTGGVAGVDYSQLQVNNQYTIYPGGYATLTGGGNVIGLDNCDLVLNVKPGLDLTGQSFVVLQSDTTDFTGMHFHNDDSWTDGTWKGTLTYGPGQVVLSNVELAAVPEPATLMLLGSGAVGFVGWMRRRRMK